MLSSSAVLYLQALRKFIDNVNNSPEASSILLNWGLKLASDSIKLDGRLIAPEELLCGKNFKFKVSAKADWTREITTNYM